MRLSKSYRLRRCAIPLDIKELPPASSPQDSGACQVSVSFASPGVTSTFRGTEGARQLG